MKTEVARARNHSARAGKELADQTNGGPTQSSRHFRVFCNDLSHPPPPSQKQKQKNTHILQEREGLMVGGSRPQASGGGAQAPQHHRQSQTCRGSRHQSRCSASGVPESSVKAMPLYRCWRCLCRLRSIYGQRAPPCTAPPSPGRAIAASYLTLPPRPPSVC